MEELPDDELRAAERALGALRDRAADPVRRRLSNVAEDDEDETAEERAAVEVARGQVARGDVVSSEALRREIGW